MREILLSLLILISACSTTNTPKPPRGDFVCGYDGEHFSDVSIHEKEATISNDNENDFNVVKHFKDDIFFMRLASDKDDDGALHFRFDEKNQRLIVLTAELIENGIVCNAK